MFVASYSSRKCSIDTMTFSVRKAPSDNFKDVFGENMIGIWFRYGLCEFKVVSFV